MITQILESNCLKVAENIWMTLSHINYLKRGEEIVAEASSGDELLHVLKQVDADVLLLDITMPGKSGDEVFELLRNDPDLKEIRVCIITGKPELRRLIYERSVPPPLREAGVAPLDL